MWTTQAIGIDEDLNLCNGDLTETKMYSQLILDHIIKPNMRHPENPDLSREMAENFLQGMNITNPYLITGFFKTWAFNLFDVLQTKEIIDEKNSGYFKFLEMLFDKLLHGKIGSMVVRPILNNLIYFNIYLANLCENHLIIKWRRNIITSTLLLCYTLGILIAIMILASFPILLMYLILFFSSTIASVCTNSQTGSGK